MTFSTDKNLPGRKSSIPRQLQQFTAGRESNKSDKLMVQTVLALMMPSLFLCFLYVCSVITVITVVFKMHVWLPACMCACECLWADVTVSFSAAVSSCHVFCALYFTAELFSFFHHLPHLHLLGAEMNSWFHWGFIRLLCHSCFIIYDNKTTSTIHWKFSSLK